MSTPSTWLKFPGKVCFTMQRSPTYRWSTQTLFALFLISGGVDTLAAAPDRPTLRVFVYTSVSDDTLVRAEAESDRILEPAGVQLLWRNCGLGDLCEVTLDSQDIVLRMVKETARGGLGCSFVKQAGGVNGVLRIENVRMLAAASGISKSHVLAAVMAHEIGHLLLGPLHARTGLMHGNWDARDLNHLEQRQLRFDAEQCRRIHAAVMTRSRPEPALFATLLP